MSVHLPVLYDTWPQLRGSLQQLACNDLQGFPALEEVLERNDRWENIRLPLALLKDVVQEGVISTLDHFCSVQMPWMAKTALLVEDLFKASGYELQNLHVGRAGEVVLTRMQVCCLMCLAFFNCFEPQKGNYQQFTFANFFSFPHSKSQRNKLLCLLNYFERIRKSEESGEGEYLDMCVSVSRKGLSKTDANEEEWIGYEKKLVPFESNAGDVIENAHGCLQVDFANEYIGGGVLGMGCVQEEIRFVISPECLVSILFCEAMEEWESILITGAEQFSTYSGYGTRFTYKGPYTDTNPVDDRQRRAVSIIAIDAVPFMYSGSSTQFKKQGILRELNKAYCGFSSTAAGDSADAQTLIPVATGNWGCGAFGGDKYLKTLIQWMAASRAGRRVKYSTFNDVPLCERQNQITEKLLGKEITVAKLYRILLSYDRTEDLFEYVDSAI